MRKSKRMLLNDCDASRKVVVGFILTPAFRTAGAALFLLNIDELGLYANVDAGTGDALDIHNGKHLAGS